jgi:NADH dehydrogenase/NADH:ubiquinone oxidoreductase subunit G
MQILGHQRAKEGRGMNILIDGKKCECVKGEFLREIARRNSITIPGLCHHNGLPSQGCCRLCVVEVVERGYSKIVVSCVYPVNDECEVFTKSMKVRQQREIILTLLVKRAPASAEIAALAKAYGAPDLPRLRFEPDGKCIMCGLCARVCKELGAGAISTVNRGIKKEIATPYNEPNPACLGCGSCANICPVKAIDITETAVSRIIWGREFMLQYCAECGALLGTAEEIAFAAQKAGFDENGLCDKCRKKNIAGKLAKTYGHFA